MDSEGNLTPSLPQSPELSPNRSGNKETTDPAKPSDELNFLSRFSSYPFEQLLSLGPNITELHKRCTKLEAYRHTAKEMQLKISNQRSRIQAVERRYVQLRHKCARMSKAQKCVNVYALLKDRHTELEIRYSDLETQFQELRDQHATLEAHNSELRDQNVELKASLAAQNAKRQKQQPLVHQVSRSMNGTVRANNQGIAHCSDQMQQKLNEQRRAIMDYPHSVTAGFCNCCGKYKNETKQLYILKDCGGPICLPCYNKFGGRYLLHFPNFNQPVGPIYNRVCEINGCRETSPSKLLDFGCGHILCRKCMDEWAKDVDAKESRWLQCGKPSCKYRIDTSTIGSLPNLDHSTTRRKAFEIDAYGSGDML